VWGAVRGAVRALAAKVLPRRAGEAGYRELGRMGEQAAERMLKGLGYSVLGRNVQVPMGEADLVCRDPDRRTAVIVEVKTRLRRKGAPVMSNEVAPEASVTAHKRRKLVTIARWLARSNGWEPQAVRIDVVGVEYVAESPRGAEPVIRHHVGAVRG
jgi:putative endonuclease